MEKESFLNIVDKYIGGDATPAEQILLEEYYNRLDKKCGLELTEEEQQLFQYAILSNIQQRIRQGEVKAKPKTYLSISRWMSAAVFLLIFSGSLYFLVSKTVFKSRTILNKLQDIPPGSNKAVLTLMNGKKISLSEAKKGEIAEQSGIIVAKTADGHLEYRATGKVKSSTLAYNTVETPRGGQYHIRLPDGSDVTLNAASSLKFPATFNGLTNRKVELSGEAYFEIAKSFDKLRMVRRPFIVVTDKQEVEVLGTHFNINSYPDEIISRTTLLEGSVKINSNIVLKPGEQALVSQNEILVKKVDAEEAVAWKNGRFVFSNEPLESIMKKISRWYDVRVDYEDKMIAKETFSGTVSRFDNISVLLKRLEVTGKVSFEINGKNITIRD